MSIEDDARRAVRAFFAKQQHKSRHFYTKTSHHGFELGTQEGGWSMRWVNDKIEMWVESYVQDDYHLHAALRDLYQIEIPVYRAGYGHRAELLGPLGLAALRASLTTTTVGD